MTKKTNARRLLTLLISLWIPAAVSAGEPALLYKSAEEMAKSAGASVPSKNAVLVLDIQDLNGRVTYFNRYLTDQLTIALSKSGDVTVVDRQIFKSILKEKKMAEAGLVDDATAITIGKVVGAKSVIYSTAMDLPDVIGINMKVIDIEKGIVVGGVVKEIKKTRSIAALIKALNEQEKESTSSTSLERQVVEIQMEDAVKERMSRGTQEAKITPEAADKKPEPSVWEKLEQSVEME